MGSVADAVSVIPILKRNLHFDFVICIKQYRPPVKAYTIEFPAGLVDPGETAESAAARELKEETGYTATITHCSPATSLDPGLESCTMVIVSAEVNGDLPENIHPKQQLEETEDIEVTLLPLNGLLQKLECLSKQGLVIDSRVWSYAAAIATSTQEMPKEIRETTGK